jgi:hypothetical protein
MIQELIVALLFAGALGYLGNIFYKSWKNEKSCSKGCGCDSSLPSHLQKQSEQKKATH